MKIGSYKDPAGFVFYKDDEIFRHVSLSYKEQYDHLMDSGLYQKLIERGLMVSHVEMQSSREHYKTLKPQKIPFISYPYEWCFSQLKDAALLMLEILEISIAHGMILKDSSAYNVQFIGNKPIFIDTLSFEIDDHSAWKGYRQFCEHFLVPLAIMAYIDGSLSKILSNYLDGISLSVASKILPLKARLNIGLFMHIFLHSRAVDKYQHTVQKSKDNKIKSLLPLIDSLKSTISKLSLRKADTQWGDYYENIHYSPAELESKKNIVQEFASKVSNINTIVDLGANTGEFAQSISPHALKIVADYDYLAIEKAYKHGYQEVLPLVIDFTNPSAAVGWRNEERASFIERTQADVTLALALSHHLLFTYKIPLNEQAQFFKLFSNNLIIEFVEPTEDQVKVIKPPEGISHHPYSVQHFEDVFSQWFYIKDKEKVEGRDRIIYLMELK